MLLTVVQRYAVQATHSRDGFAGSHEGQREGSRQGVEEGTVLGETAHERPALEVDHEHANLQHSTIAAKRCSSGEEQTRQP